MMILLTRQRHDQLYEFGAVSTDADSHRRIAVKGTSGVWMGEAHAMFFDGPICSAIGELC